MRRSELKIRFSIGAAIVFSVLTLLFALLWIFEANDNEDMINLAQFEAKASYESFKKYSEAGDESAYINGVASFRAFQQAYFMISDETSAEYLSCNSLYGFMTASPEKVKAQIQMLTEAMRLLSDDVSDPNGYMRISSLNHALIE